MNTPTFCLIGSGKALQYAKEFLIKRGIRIADSPSPSVTHALLPVPSFDQLGNIRDGITPKEVFDHLSENVTIFGGNLTNPSVRNYRCVDFLQDPYYLASNAAITADCALTSLASKLPVVLDGCSILIIGWGRIGKCLCKKLSALGADVTVAARKETDRATLQSLGYRTVSTDNWADLLPHFRAVVNTAPVPVMTEADASRCNGQCVFLDLASKQGILADNVYWERSLPNRDAPESSGNLIAQTTLRFLRKEGWL